MSNLKKIREQKNLTQEELAELSGISVRTIQRIESGTSPKGFTLKTLAKSLQISEKDLLETTPEILKTSIDEAQIPITTSEEELETNIGLIKIINLSSDLWYLSGGGIESIHLMVEEIATDFQ